MKRNEVKRFVLLFLTLGVLLSGIFGMADTAFAVPADWIAPWLNTVHATFGYRPAGSPVNPHPEGPEGNLWGGERGPGYAIDFMLPRGTQLYAPERATVHCSPHAIDTRTSCATGHGYFGAHIILNIGAERVLFAHLEEGSISVRKANGEIGRGYPIGRVGRTGNANNTDHLHFEIIGKRNLVGQNLYLFGRPLSVFERTGTSIQGGFMLPQQQSSFEVRSVNRDTSGNVSVTIANQQNGATSSIPARRIQDNGYLIKFPDRTTFHIKPEFGINSLDTDPYFATGSGGERLGGTLRFRSGQTVTFGTHGAATVSCTLWMNEPTPTTRHEVRNVVLSPLGHVTVTVANLSTGATSSIQATRGYDGCYLVKFPDWTTFNVKPEFGILALDSDPYFATGSGERINTTLRFRNGQTVTFGAHGAARVSCSLWMNHNPSTPAVRPSASLDNGFYNSPQTVTLHTETTGATILYTLDGTVPTADSTTYTAPISIASDSTLQAIAVRPDMSSSPVLLRSYAFMDVNAIVDDGDDGGTSTSNGGDGGGGCNVGFLPLAFFVVTMFFRKR